MAAVEPVKAEPTGNPARWVEASDLPEIGKEADVTTFDLTIDRSGKPSHCAIVIRSGSDKLDAAVCKALVKRARFRPAIGLDGSTVFYVRRDRVVWIPHGTGPNRAYDDADVVITSPDIRSESDHLAELLLTIGEDGTVSKCSISRSSGEESLDNLACRVASDPHIALPIFDAAGHKVPGLRSLFIAFRAGPEQNAVLR